MRGAENSALPQNVERLVPAAVVHVVCLLFGAISRADSIMLDSKLCNN